MTRLLRVVHVTPGLEVGGLEKLLVEFARHADRRWFHLHFVSLSNPGLLAGDIQALGWPVTALEQPQGLRPSLIVRLARLVRQLRADIVHTHDDRANIYGAPAARLAGVPVVLHTRHHQGSQLTPRQRWLIRAVSLADSRFVCISHDSARWAARQGIPRGKLRVVHNGIDTDRFAFTGPDPAGYAVFVGRLVPEKDISTLLQAVALVACTLPDFRLLIAGDGPERGSLQQRTEQLGLGERVAFLGNVREVPALLARARLFVLSSLTEGISLTLLEAMARGLPVVATCVGGNPEVVADGQTGLLVPARDPLAMADRIRQLWLDPSHAAALGLAGRMRVLEYFDIRQMVARYEQLYLQESRSARGRLLNPWNPS